MLCSQCFLQLPRFLCPGCGHDNTRSIVAKRYVSIVGVAGPMGAGKSTFAKMLASKFTGNTHCLPFAGPVKNIATMMGWNGNKDEKGRRLLQLIGTECGRECIDPDIWINKWSERAKTVDPCTFDSLIYADDLRFENEAECIKSMGGILIKLKRKTCVINPNHPSETGLDDGIFDYIYDNNNGINDLNIFASKIHVKIHKKLKGNK